MKKVFLVLFLSLFTSILIFACSEDSTEDILVENEEQNTDEDSDNETTDEDSDEADAPNEDSNDDPEDEGNSDDEDSSIGTEITLVASPDIIINDGEGAQSWGEGVTLEAFKIDGTPAQLVYDTQFQDKGFGVAGARWQQIDFYVMYQGQEVNASEKIVISFETEVADVILTVGMLGLNEGVGEDDETGKWIAFNGGGEKVAEGIFGPDDSDLGPENKLGGYGQYPFTLQSESPIVKIEIEATGFGYGQGEPKTVNSYDNESGNKENNSDFNIMGISFTRP